MSTTEAENKATVQHLYEQLFNQGNLSVADEVIAPDFINHNATPGSSNRGPESMRQLITMLSTAFPDMHYTIEELVAEGDTVVARVTVSGTHRGPFQGLPPTGRSFRQDQMHFIRFRDGKVVEHRAVRDDLGVMRQLGVIAAPADAR
ncbi:MAG TPA: ester cyclase [Ktedonobacteraceae bacterium]|nr:ester cyclase [Ktedonobacteraceae bacterium]